MNVFFATRIDDTAYTLDFRGKIIDEIELSKGDAVEFLRERIGKHVFDTVITNPGELVDISKCEVFAIR